MPEQADMTSSRRTAFAPFVLDLVDFMDEKIREAITDEGSRVAAVAEAAGALPLLRDRLRENEVAKAQFMLVFDEYLYEPYATQWWADFARMDRSSFEEQAARLVGPDKIFAVLRVIAADAGGA
jgi:hypothetical protein